jgi:uncharacterized protein (TIGR03083 family)
MNTKLKGTEPILCASIIRQVDQHLIELLTSLDSDEWDLPTVVPQWSVRDVAAHLLDTALRKLSTGRDRCRVERVDVRSHQDLITLVNRLNREGVIVYRRLSPPVLTQIMQLTCAQTADFYESLDPFARATIGVSWAGETTSLVWFDTARELTERWHHQEQIRLATNRTGIMTPLLYHPVLDTFLRGFRMPTEMLLPQLIQRFLSKCRAIAVANGAFSGRTIAGATLASFHPTSPLTSSSRNPLRGAFSPRAWTESLLAPKSR